MGSAGEITRPGAVLQGYVRALVDELSRSGVSDVCLCPGSRSAPLAISLWRQPDLRVWLHLDERSAAFFALGMAKALRKPVAVAGTSGTAVVNFAPAVAEARNAAVPLIVLSADRPPELRGVGASQTIDQIQLYGSHAKWSQDLLLPEAGPQAERYARTMADRAVAVAAAEPPGPVHLNLPFREPLIPDRAERAAVESRAPTVETLAAPRTPSSSDIGDLATEFAATGEGLIVCGPLDEPGFPEAVAKLGRALGWPVLADVLSQVRTGPQAGENVIDNYDAFLRPPGMAQDLRPETILRFGATPVSKPLAQFLELHAASPQTLVAADGTWLDPGYSASRVVFANSVAFCNSLLSALKEAGLPNEAGSQWASRWRRLREATRESLTAALEEGKELNEASAVQRLAGVLPENAAVFAGNSMPVRDLDSFLPRSTNPQRFLANRGASGIDGVVSSALGVAAATKRPTVLLIGDVSLYHDSNGLLAAQRYGQELNATIIVLNNDGGGIFSFLPQFELPEEEYEPLFGTPHGLDFRHLAGLYGVSYDLAEDGAAFDALIEGSLRRQGVKIIEVATDRGGNLEKHRELWRRAAEANRAVLAQI